MSEAVLGRVEWSQRDASETFYGGNPQFHAEIATGPSFRPRSVMVAITADEPKSRWKECELDSVKRCRERKVQLEKLVSDRDPLYNATTRIQNL
jgi:hypothetical protein